MKSEYINIYFDSYPRYHTTCYCINGKVYSQIWNHLSNALKWGNSVLQSNRKV